MMSDTARLIGFSGYARAGKDTAALALVEDGWHRAAFGDILKEFALAVDPFIPVDAYTQRLSEIIDEYGWECAKDGFPEVRRILQAIGTDAGRNLLGYGTWVAATMASLPPAQNVAFADVRFPNEADAIRSQNGLVVRINRPGFGPVNGHSSETALDDYDFDFVLDNDGTVADLHAKVRAQVAGRLQLAS